MDEMADLVPKPSPFPCHFRNRLLGLGALDKDIIASIGLRGPSQPVYIHTFPSGVVHSSVTPNIHTYIIIVLSNCPCRTSRSIWSGLHHIVLDGCDPMRRRSSDKRYVAYSVTLKRDDNTEEPTCNEWQTTQHNNDYQTKQ